MEIPGIYLDVLRSGPVEPLAAVVRHSESDVRSLARLLAHVERRYADRPSRTGAPRGTSPVWRAFVRERQDPEALDCIDDALAAAPAVRDPFGRTPVATPTDPDARGELPWWCAPGRSGLRRARSTGRLPGGHAGPRRSALDG